MEDLLDTAYGLNDLIAIETLISTPFVVHYSSELSSYINHCLVERDLQSSFGSSYNFKVPEQLMFSKVYMLQVGINEVTREMI